ncbi:copper resistance protein NlpE N-terminal domain-containing protein [Kushneria aurantia]|uniref:Copper resistance protein NlpE N-terminal domain-containing protein n=1 Tax=Kushneria aurantia TaxID=504092 RepID=A0ABV6G372_9GAMM|nr:copper resistance protein NlpE N-terminal domain-containing protein [Kushneria aurantia]
MQSSNNLIAPLMLASLVLAGCDGERAPSQNNMQSSGTHQVFAGTLPCNNCEAIDARLVMDFRHDSQGGPFTLTETRRGGPDDGETHDIKGEWRVISGPQVSGEGSIYVLRPAPRGEEFSRRYFRMAQNSTMRPVDDNYQPLYGDRDAQLQRR